VGLAHPTTDEHDLEELNNDTSPISPFYKGCLIVFAILVILALVSRLLL
jgi:hypothetical protein